MLEAIAAIVLASLAIPAMILLAALLPCQEYQVLADDGSVSHTVHSCGGEVYTLSQDGNTIYMGVM